MSEQSAEQTNQLDENAEEPSVTLIDVLEQQKELEEESVAVLGGSDEKCCTYSKGYIKRQALYSCLTCCAEARSDFNKGAGICLACSYQCHEGHELIELYTKRNFRCDCSTERIAEKKCNFTDLQSGTGCKNAPNSENVYNQNFSGDYCICKRPYPDPDDPIPDDMIQCIICEDWYHTRHLDSSAPKPETYSEMICGGCMDANCFLKDYAGISINKIDDTNESVEAVVSEDDDKLKSELDKSISDIMNISQSSIPDDDVQSEPQRKKLKLDESSESCVRPTVGSNYKKGGVFWPDNWRKNLCVCIKCKKMYDDLGVAFLLDPEDSVQFYEENGLKKVESDYERGIRALSSMDRVQQIDVITEYNKMKDKLKEFLQPFVTNKKVVTEDDINNFFQSMKNEKNSHLGMPYFCR